MESEHTEPASVDRLPREIGKPATRALHAAGFTHLDQLAAVTERELLDLHGMGPKAIGILRAALHARGKTFAGPKSD